MTFQQLPQKDLTQAQKSHKGKHKTLTFSLTFQWYELEFIAGLITANCFSSDAAKYCTDHDHTSEADRGHRKVDGRGRPDGFGGRGDVKKLGFMRRNEVVDVPECIQEDFSGVAVGLG